MQKIAPIIAAQLPFLRRYARALTGSQASGDAYVAAALETLVEDPSLFGDDVEPRVAVYEVFTRIWSSISVNREPGEAGGLTSAHRTLEALAPRSRQIFLLVSVEGFSTAEAARIVGIDEDEVTRAIDEIGRELASLVATDVLIIEDEPIIAMDIEALVESLGHRVAGVARTQKEAVALASQTRPGLVLADIQLADGSSGLDAVNDILAEFSVPVIFITAYPERFLTGERPEPAFLIPKPFQPATVSAVVSQALFFERNAKRPERRASA